MEVEKFISALEETILFLRNSQSSLWASMDVGEIIRDLEIEIIKSRNSKPNDIEHLKLLFGPTGSIQETAIDNGWGDDFLRISEVVDRYTINAL